MSLRPLSALLVAFTLSACTPPVSQGNFDAPDPASRTYAIERAVHQHDLTAIPSIVETLDSDDPSVRFVAIAALERLTGQTYGYAYDDPPAKRREAITRWNEAIDTGSIEAGSPEAGSLDAASLEPSAEHEGEHD